MTFDHLQAWIGLVLVLWNCGLSAALWLRKPGNDAAVAVGVLRDDMDERLKAQASQITEIRAHMEHMPTNEELMQLEGTVKQINERTTGLADNMATVRASLHRIEDFLLRERRQ